MSKKSIIIISSVILLIVFCSQITFFVIQPIGAIPEGKTLVILRMNKTNFIDSADAMCDREMGGVSLLCRGMMMAAVAKKSTILVRLPYSETLHNISTDGKTYGR
jgi:hypothetical protein